MREMKGFTYFFTFKDRETIDFNLIPMIKG